MRIAVRQKSSKLLRMLRVVRVSVLPLQFVFFLQPHRYVTAVTVHLLSDRNGSREHIGTPANTVGFFRNSCANLLLQQIYRLRLAQGTLVGRDTRAASVVVPPLNRHAGERFPYSLDISCNRSGLVQKIGAFLIFRQMTDQRRVPFRL